MKNNKQKCVIQVLPALNSGGVERGTLEMSDMHGTKAVAIEKFLKTLGNGYIRFNCRGHGESKGNFPDFGIDDWADDNFDHSEFDFIGGANLWVHTDRKPIGAAKMNTFGEAPSWGKDWKAFIARNADRSNTSYIQKTTLPYTNNYLDLDPSVKDSIGLPVTRITARYRENELRIAAFAQDKMEEWYRAAGATHVLRFGLGNAMGATPHAYGCGGLFFLEFFNL